MIDAGLLGHFLGGVLMGCIAGLGVAAIIAFSNRGKMRELLAQAGKKEDAIKKQAADIQADLKIELAKYKKMVAEYAFKDKLAEKIEEAKSKVEGLIKNDKE
jgi:tagatose-1,6-bisphosphate aldolase